jgi:ketosteroid isomerase-like protein
MRSCCAFHLFGALAFSAGCRPQATTLSSADQQALRAAPDSYAQRIRLGDYAGVAALYAPNAQLLPPNAAAVAGRDAILKWYGALPISFSSFEVTVDEAVGEGDLAYVRGHYMVTGTPHGAKAAFSDTGQFVEAHRRQPDGSWPIVADIWNSDKPQTR